MTIASHICDDAVDGARSQQGCGASLRCQSPFRRPADARDLGWSVNSCDQRQAICFEVISVKRKPDDSVTLDAVAEEDAFQEACLVAAIRYISLKRFLGECLKDFAVGEGNCSSPPANIIPFPCD